MTPAIAAFLNLYRAGSSLVVPEALPAPICREAADDVVLATALAAGADAIVSGDQDLLVLRSYERIRIISPRSLLEELDGPNAPGSPRDPAHETPIIKAPR